MPEKPLYVKTLVSHYGLHPIVGERCRRECCPWEQISDADRTPIAPEFAHNFQQGRRLGDQHLAPQGDQDDWLNSTDTRRAPDSPGTGATSSAPGPPEALAIRTGRNTCNTLESHAK
jgi:hypothetical protein